MKYFNDITDDDFVNILIDREIYQFKGDAITLNLNDVSHNEEEILINTISQDESDFISKLEETFLSDSLSNKFRRMVLIWNKNEADVFAKKTELDEFIIKVAFRLPFIKK